MAPEKMRPEEALIRAAIVLNATPPSQRIDQIDEMLGWIPAMASANVKRVERALLGWRAAILHIGDYRDQIREAICGPIRKWERRRVATGRRISAVRRRSC